RGPKLLVGNWRRRLREVLEGQNVFDYVVLRGVVEAAPCVTERARGIRIERHERANVLDIGNLDVDLHIRKKHTPLIHTTPTRRQIATERDADKTHTHARTHTA